MNTDAHAFPGSDLDRAIDLLRAERFEEGIRELERLHFAFPDHADVTGTLAFHRLKQCSWERAKELLLQLADIPGRGVCQDEWYYRAWAEAGLANHAAALDCCCRALENGESHEVRGFASVIALRLGDPEKAIRFLEPVVGRVALHSSATVSDRMGKPEVMRVAASWFIASFLLRAVAGASALPTDAPRQRTRFASLLSGGLGRIRVPGEIALRARRMAWEAWQYEHGFGAGLVPVRRLPLAPRALERYREVLNATIDGLLRLPLCPIPVYLIPITRAQDAVNLYCWAFEHTPARFIHVGGYLGVPACLCALALRDAGAEARIVTVDPFICCPETNPREFSEKLAADLGVSDSIEIHRGFFNHVTPHDYPPHMLPLPPVVGRQVLERLGGADAFFIDGDHSRVGVVADTLLASEFLAPAGSLIYHDVHSLSTVRRGLYPFVAEHGTAFEYSEIVPSSIDGLGVLRKRGGGRISPGRQG